MTAPNTGTDEFDGPEDFEFETDEQAADRSEEPGLEDDAPQGDLETLGQPAPGTEAPVGTRERDPVTGQFKPAAPGQAPDPAQAAPPTAPGQAPAPSDGTFRFKADRQEWQIDGSRVDAQGLHIPTEHIPMVQELLAEGVAHRGSFQQELARRDTMIRQLQQDNQKAASGRSEKEVQAETILTHFARLMDEGPEAVIDWLDNLQQNRPVLEAEAKAAALQYRLQQLEAANQPSEPSPEEILPQLDNALREHLVTTGDGEFKGILSDEDLGRAYQHLWDTVRERVFYRAVDDIPELGVSRGEIIIDADFVKSQLQLMAQGRPSVAAAAQGAAATVTKTLTRNARLGVTGLTPSKPRRDNVPDPDVQQGEPDWTTAKFKSKKDFDAAFWRGSPLKPR